MSYRLDADYLTDIYGDFMHYSVFLWAFGGFRFLGWICLDFFVVILSYFRSLILHSSHEQHGIHNDIVKIMQSLQISLMIIYRRCSGSSGAFAADVRRRRYCL